jgi:hypothetical protein
MARRLKKELSDIEFRIAQGLDCCDQFFDDEQLLQCRHSRSKSLFLFPPFKAPLDFYTRALKGNDDVIRVSFLNESDSLYAWFAETISHLPSVTSIKVINPRRLPPIQRDTPLFIDDFNPSQSLETFLNNDQSLARTRATYVFMQYNDDWTIAVSFVGPSSGKLILRLKHRARAPDTTLTVLGTSFTLAIPESITIDDINLHPISESTSQLSFTPNARKNLILRASSGYAPQDLQLLDEDRNTYGLPSPRNIPAADFDALRMPDDRESG